MVSQLINSKGNPTLNQFIISNGETIGFQSYNSLVCEIRGRGMGFDNNIVLGRDYDYSRTTMKYLVQFLEQNGFTDLDSIKAVRDAIEHTEKYGHVELNGQQCAVWYDETMR